MRLRSCQNTPLIGLTWRKHVLNIWQDKLKQLHLASVWVFVWSLCSVFMTTRIPNTKWPGRLASAGHMDNQYLVFKSEVLNFYSLMKCKKNIHMSYKTKNLLLFLPGVKEGEIWVINARYVRCRQTKLYLPEKLILPFVSLFKKMKNGGTPNQCTPQQFVH